MLSKKRAQDRRTQSPHLPEECCRRKGIKSNKDLWEKPRKKEFHKEGKSQEFQLGVPG